MVDDNTPDEDKKGEEGSPTRQKDGNVIRADFSAKPDSVDAVDGSVDKKPPTLWEIMPATIVLIALIVAIYFYTSPEISQSSRTMTRYWVFSPYWFEAGEWWRLVTGALVHADLQHLFGNAFFIFIFGQMLEPVLGWRQMTILMFSSAVSAHIFSYFLLDAPTLGASGIAYGLLAAFLMMDVMVVRRFGTREQFTQSLFKVVVIGLIYAWFDTSRPNVNFYGHLGGAVAGLIYGVILFSSRIKRYEDRNRLG